MRDGATELHAWYDAHARDLPWRVGPAARRSGQRPEPYRVWLSEIMLQQTTVAAVKGYFERFVSKWPTVRDLAAAGDDEVMAAWAGLGYYARARNLLACARTVADAHDGAFPDTEDALRRLPGIGPYTAAAIAAIAFDRPATVVDGNVERVVARLHAVDTPMPYAKRTLRDLAAEMTPADRPGDHAQAMMDLGATICTPRNPACGVCPLMARCAARLQGTARDLPRKRAKPAKPIRLGVAWVARNGSGLWLMERRPERGLLGGMLGWPGTDWSDAPEGAPPIEADWRPAGEVRHTFTHFHLKLEIRAARVDDRATPARGRFRPLDPAALPTVMRKAHALAASRLRVD